MHDPLNNAHHVIVVLKGGARFFQHTIALDIDLIIAVDHHLGDGVFSKKNLEWPKAKNLVKDVVEKSFLANASRDFDISPLFGLLIALLNDLLSFRRAFKPSSELISKSHLTLSQKNFI